MIRLRQVTASDFELVRGWFEDPSMAEYWRAYPPAFVWLKEETFLSSMTLAYIIEEDGEAKGLLRMGQVDERAKKAEFGLAIPGPTKGRSKIAIEALAQLFAYVFDYAGLNKVVAMVLTHREDLKHLLTKWNFKEEGRLRDNCYFAGQFHDELAFGLTRPDYEIAKEKYKWQTQ